MIRRATMTIWEREHPARPRVSPGDAKFPNQETNWGNNNVSHQDHMKDFRELIIKGIREAVLQSQNLTKAFNIQQGKEEGPSEFLTRLKEQMKKYSGLDPEDLLGQGLLKIHFITNNWPDISKKLQKLQNWNQRGLEELLRDAPKG
jgi:hypothetical protein